MPSDRATILAIDDTSESLSLLVSLLSGEGYHVLPADSGELALIALARTKPDLILLDMRLNGMDGLEVCRRLKADDSTRDIPVILMSAYAITEEWAEGLRLGAADFISKPFRAGELLTRVKTYLALYKSWDSMKKQEAELRESHLHLNAEIAKRQEFEKSIRFLSQERDLLQAVMDGAKNSHLVFLDCNFNFIRVNATYAATCGFTAEEMIGKNHFELYPDSENEAIFTRVRDTGEAFEIHDKPFTFPDQPGRGTTYWDWTLTPIKDTDGNTKGLVFSLFETTERRQAENAMRESEEKFASLFRNAPVLIALSDLATGRYLDVNEEKLRVSGYTREEVIGHTAEDIGWISHETRSLMIDELMNSHHIRNMEINLRCKNGNPITGIVKGEVVRISGHDCFLTVTVDITDRKNMEQELAETSERLDLATSSARLGVWDLNLENKSLYWNDRMFELYGVVRQSFSNTFDEWTGSIHPDDRQRAIETFQRAITGEIEYDTIFRVIHPDGTVLHLKANGIVLRNGSGKPVRMLGINADITENIRTDLALQNAQKLESLGILAGGIAHDFNNLLGGIYGYIDIAAGDPEQYHSYLEKAKNTIDRARGLTQQLLTFAKGGEPVKKVGALFPFVEDTARFALSGSRVTLTVTAPADLWLCDFDRNKVGQVIDNLIINAQQAMPSGGAITISACNMTISKPTTHLTPGRYINIAVKDTGIGMTEEMQSRIFDPFYTTKPKGHGLGLATCYSIIIRHNGCIEVKSIPGKGSVFSIYLPASEGSSAVDALQNGWSHSGTGTVIIMDDEDIILDTTSSMLKSFGYSVITTHHGEETIAVLSGELAEHRTVRFAIVDLTIPGGKGGTDIIDEIKTLCPGMPVFVASGYADNPVMANPQKYGFTASISKPFLKSTLCEMLEQKLYAMEIQS